MYLGCITLVTMKTWKYFSCTELIKCYVCKVQAKKVTNKNELVTCSMQLSGENWKSKSVGEFIIEARLNITFFLKVCRNIVTDHCSQNFVVLSKNLSCLPDQHFFKSKQKEIAPSHCDLSTRYHFYHFNKTF